MKTFLEWLEEMGLTEGMFFSDDKAPKKEKVPSTVYNRTPKDGWSKKSGPAASPMMMKSKMKKK